MTDPLSQNETATSAQPTEPAGRVVNVEIGEVIFDGFGPVHYRPVTSGPVTSSPVPARSGSSRQGDSGRQAGRRQAAGRLGAAAAAAFRRELARELAVAGPEAEQLATAIADAVFRQLKLPPRGGAR
jgi:hypothetical protein